MQDILLQFPGGKRVDALLGGRRIRTDQPTELGGDDTAPAPYDLFLASLATCAGIYVLGFLNARNLSTEGIEIRQHTDFDDTTHLARKVTLDIELPETFPEKYRASVARVAEGCKVKKTIAGSLEFEVRTSVRASAAGAVA